MTADEALRRMKADLAFGMRFMPIDVPAKLAYKQARHVLSGVGGPVPYTEEERELLNDLALRQARRVLLGSLLDCLNERNL